MRLLGHGCWLAVLGLAGCAATGPSHAPSAVVPPGSAATLQFYKGYKSGFGVSGIQNYFVSTTSRCEDLRLAATLLWTRPDGQTSAAPVDQPVLVFAATQYIVSTGGYGLSNPQCHSRATFTPTAGHVYKVTAPALLGGDCRVEVVDQATGASPSDLAVEDGAACLRVLQREEALNKSRPR